jgi:hypothetical protein
MEKYRFFITVTWRKPVGNTKFKIKERIQLIQYLRGHHSRWSLPIEDLLPKRSHGRVHGKSRSHRRCHWYRAHLRELSLNDMKFITISIFMMDGQM